MKKAKKGDTICTDVQGISPLFCLCENVCHLFEHSTLFFKPDELSIDSVVSRVLRRGSLPSGSFVVNRGEQGQAQEAEINASTTRPAYFSCREYS